MTYVHSAELQSNTKYRALHPLSILNHCQQVLTIACFSCVVFRKGGNIHKNHKALNTVTHKLFRQDASCCHRSLFSQRKTRYSPASAEAAMMSLDSEAQCVAEANRAAHRDLSNKANANR